MECRQEAPPLLHSTVSALQHLSAWLASGALCWQQQQMHLQQCLLLWKRTTVILRCIVALCGLMALDTLAVACKSKNARLDQRSTVIEPSLLPQRVAVNQQHLQVGTTAAASGAGWACCLPRQNAPPVQVLLLRVVLQFLLRRAGELLQSCLHLALSAL
jgi:hypothetical protein